MNRSIKFLPRLQDIFFIAVFFAVLALGARLFSLDGDLGRHITIGNVILEQRHILTSDIFSHTMNGESLAPHEWLTQVAFALAHRLMGLDGVVLLTAFTLALAFTLLYQDIERKGVNPLLAILSALLAAAVSSIHFLARPHIFTILFLAIWTPIVLRLERGEGQRSAYLLPLIMLVWVNSHGAYIAGFVVLGAAFVGAVWEWIQKQLPFNVVKRLALAGAASTLVLFINPVGAKVIETSLGYIQNDYLVSHTQEYLPPNFHNSGFLPFLILLSLMVFCFGLGWKRLRLSEGLLAAGWTAMSLYSARNIPLFAIVIMPIIASALQAGWDKISILKQVGDHFRTMEGQARGFLWPALTVIAVCILAINSAFGTYNTYNSRLFPVQAMDWLEAQPQSGNMFNYFTWGGYILYRSWPQNLVFIDGQTDFYGEALTRDYETIFTLGAGWERLMQTYQIAWVIVHPDEPLVRALTEQGWKTLYQDSTAIILRK